MEHTKYRGAARHEHTTGSVPISILDTEEPCQKPSRETGASNKPMAYLKLVWLAGFFISVPFGPSHTAQDLRVKVLMQAPVQSSNPIEVSRGTALDVPFPLPLIPPSDGMLNTLKVSAALPLEPGDLVQPARPSEKQHSPTVTNGALDSWKQFAVSYDADPTKPWIAIVIDDVGVNHRGAKMAVEMPAPLTLAFMTYADNLEELSQQALGRGHELLLHFPMEPDDLKRNDPGPNALMVGLSETELDRRLEWGLNRFKGFVGLNNHMGSRFTRNRVGMRRVALALRKRGLIFLDSMTTGSSVAAAEARRVGLTVLERDIFLDHIPTSEEVRRQLALLEQRAKAKGFAIGIGHPQTFTLDVIRAWLPIARARGFDIVPISVIARRLEGVG
ncbi:polysaccharide deacetylase 2 family uncharacterized protein YibQ [Limibacillus sp. MBR-115]